MPKERKFEAGGVALALFDLTLPNGLIISRLEITGSKMMATIKPYSLTSDAAPFTATLTAEDIARFLTKKSPTGIKDFSVELRDDRAFVKASMRVVLEVEASVVCRLVIQEKKRLVVELETVHVLGVGAKNLVQRQLDDINPIFEADDLPVRAEFEEMKLQDGEAILTGHIWPEYAED